MTKICMFCGDEKKKFDYVDSDGRVVRAFVCLNTGCFADPFAKSPSRQHGFDDAFVSDITEASPKTQKTIIFGRNRHLDKLDIWIVRLFLIGIACFIAAWLLK